MGVVWLANDNVLDRQIALKFLPEIVRMDEASFEELKAETKRCLDLTHPNIVRIHDIVHDDRSAAIAMEYVPGKSLAALRLKRPKGVFDVEETERILGQLIDALRYAHDDAKVVHRDLKPGNVLMSESGAVKLADFGISRSISDSVSRASMQFSSSGTLAYMSPQQALGEAPAVTDDVYSLGAMVYELLTSKPPFFRGELLAQVEKAKAPSMLSRRSELGIEGSPIPDSWERAVARALSKTAEDRQGSAMDFWEELHGHKTARSQTQPSVSFTAGLKLTQQTQQRPIAEAPRQKKPWPAVAVSLTAITLVIGLLFFGSQARRTGESRPPAAISQEELALGASPKPSPSPSALTKPVPAPPSPAAGSASAKQSNLTVPDDLPTIAQAIAQAADHATIHLRSGEYRESLEITRALTLTCEKDAEAVIVSPSDQVSTLTITNSKGVRLEHLQFRHPGDVLESGKFAPVLSANHSDVSLDQCAVEAGAGDGAVFSGEGTSQISNSSFTGNADRGLVVDHGAKVEVSSSRFERNGTSGMVVVFGGAHATIVNCTHATNGHSGLEVSRGGIASVTSSTFSGNRRAGIFLEGTATAASTIDGCNCTENKGFGIHVQNGAVAQIAGGSVNRNEERGISFVDPGANCSVIGTQIADNTYYGIFFQAHSPVPALIRATVCSGHAYSGIVGDGPALLTIKDNHCDLNREDGILLGNGMAGELSGNVCSKNSRYGISLSEASPNLILGENELKENAQAPLFRQ
jgi:parallel beta-helix repeat protein